MSDDREAFAPLPEGRGKLDVLLELGGAKAIVAERDELRERIQSVLDYCGAIDLRPWDEGRGQADTDAIRDLLEVKPGRPAQAGTDSPVDAALEDQTMPDSRPNTQN